MGTIFADHGIHAAGNLIPAAEYDFFAGWDLKSALERYGKTYIEAAERELENPYPILDASLYMEYARNGNRNNYETPYFLRRTMLLYFVLAELAEKQGRFKDKIIDGVWHILEESTWIIPAHIRTNKNNNGTPLPDAFSTTDEDDDVKHIDLFSATTGACMAVLWRLTADILDPEAVIIRRRMLSQLKQRILHPFYTYNHDWWMGLTARKLNNWTPWIISNVLVVLALCEEDDAKREAGAEKCMEILDRFTREYPEDGGCDEGPGYWGGAAASYFDCLELLHSLSGGKIDVYDDELINNMCAYIMNFSITPDTYINFADASAHICPNFRLIQRMGRKLNNPRLESFAASVVTNPGGCSPNQSHFYRSLLDMQEPIPEKTEFVPHEKIWYPNLQVAISRDLKSGMFLALKGGNNAESHNHNDVGQFILFDGSTPVILDAGVEQYTRDTFSSRRYTLWAMRASYHNLPELSGCEELNGTQYNADVVEYCEDTGALTLELKNAYPAEAKVESYRRTAVLEGSTAKVVDEIRLTEPGSIVFHYITLDKPEFVGNTIRFASGHTAEFDASLIPTVDEIDLKGGKISREWKRESLWRINLTAPEKAAEAEYTMTIHQ